MKNYGSESNPNYTILNLDNDDIIYLMVKPSDSDEEPQEQSIDLKVTKVVVPTDWKSTGSDGSYEASVGERTVMITPVVGYSSLAFNIDVGDSGYASINYKLKEKDKEDEGYIVENDYKCNDGTNAGTPIEITLESENMHSGIEYSLELSIEIEKSEKLVFSETFTTKSIEDDISVQMLELDKSAVVDLDESGEKWLKVTAAEAGDYRFRFDPRNYSNIDINLYKGSIDDESSMGEYILSGNNQMSVEISLENDQPVYIKAAPVYEGDTEQSFDVIVSRVISKEESVVDIELDNLENFSSNDNRNIDEKRWLRFTAEEEGNYRLRFTPQNGNIYVSLYRDSFTGEQIGYEQYIYSGNQWSTTVSLTAKQSIYIEAYPTDNRYAGQSFDVIVSKNVVEELTLDNSKNIQLEDGSTESEAQWLKFTAEEEGNYRFRFTPQSGSYIYVSLYRDSITGEQIGYTQYIYNGNQWSTTVSLTAKQSVYIKAYLPYNGYTDQSFDVIVSKVLSPEESAEDLTLDVSKYISLEDGSTEDEAKWLRFTALEEGYYRFRFDAYTGSNIRVFLYRGSADDSDSIYSGNIYKYIEYDDDYGYEYEDSNCPWTRSVSLTAGQPVYIKAYPSSIWNTDQGFDVMVSKALSPEELAEDLALGLSTISLNANNTEDEAKWLRFTASEAGDYLFWFNTKNNSDIKVYLYQESTENQIAYKNVYGSEGDEDNPWSKTVTLAANQKVYIKAYPYYEGRTSDIFDLNVSKVVKVTDRTKNADGSYQATVNGRTIKVTPDVSYRSFNAAVSVSPQSPISVNYVVRNDWSSREGGVTAQNGAVTIEVPGLSMGTKYSLELSLLINRNESIVFASRNNPLEFTTLDTAVDGDDRSIEVSATPRLNRADVKITVKGKAAEYTSNDVWFFYKKAGAEEWSRTNFSVYGTSAYKGSVSGLEKETEYTYVAGFADGSESEVTPEKLSKSVTGNFTTLEDDREVSVTIDTYLKEAELKFAVSGNAAKENTNYIGFYYKEQGSNAGWSSLGSYDMYVYGVGTKSKTISGLKQGTTYEYVYGFGDSYNMEKDELTGGNVGKDDPDTFTIPADDRKVTVESSDITTKMTTAAIRVAVTGNAAVGITNYVILYYKGSGSDDWNRYSTSRDGRGTVKINLSDLDSGKIYEYVIGLGDYSDTSREELIGTATGSFTTAASTLELTDVKLSAGYTSVQAEASFAGNNTGSRQYIYLFYRAESEADWSKYQLGYSNAEKYTNYTRTRTGLTANTKYEYYVVVADNTSVSSPNEIIGDNLKKSGDFTTNKSPYSLTVTVDENKTTYNSAALNVTAAGGQDRKVRVTLKYRKETEDSADRSGSVVLRQTSGYQGVVNLSSLEPNTAYLVESAQIAVQDQSQEPYSNSGWYVIDTITLENVKFTTKEATYPTEVTVTPNAVTLNYGDSEGNHVKLEAEFKPAEAINDLYWECADSKIAYVYSDGSVYARGVGTTKIYAKSLNNPETVYGVSEVTVKDYVIRTKNGETYTGTQSLNKKKTLGSTDNKLGLYVKDTGESVTISNVEIVKSGIASWNDGVLTATAVGRTKVVFTAADGAKASITLDVTAAADHKGFGIRELTNKDYPAKLDNGTYRVAEGKKYTAVVEVSPLSSGDEEKPGNFTWTSSNEAIATVANGVITAVAAGDATITVTPVTKEGESSPYKQDKVEIKLTVQKLPSTSSPAVYALTNLGTKGKMTLEEVNIIEALGKDWKWVYPDTPLYSLSTNRDYYAFEAVYSGTEYYPCETTVKVYIGTVTGVNAWEYYDDDEYMRHNQVLEVSSGDTTDALYLRADSGCIAYDGAIDFSKIAFSILSSKDGLTIEEKTIYGSKVFMIKATVAGTYDLKLQVVPKDANGKIISDSPIAQTSYKIKVVTDPQVGNIEFTSTDKDITVDGNHIYLDYTDAMKNRTINLTAIARDRQGKEIGTALQWKVTDSAVANVKADKNNTHAATVTVKGDGHAVLSVAAKDSAGLTEEIGLEFRDHKPRVSTDKASVNLAYEYESSAGRSLAQQKLGVVEIASVYNESIERVELYAQDGVTPVTNMSLYPMSVNATGVSTYIVKPENPDNMSTGTNQYKLAVKTVASRTPYLYDLKVTVTDKAPKVTAKMQDTINLFDLNAAGSIKLTVSNDYPVSNLELSEVTWKQKSSGIDNGFEVESYIEYNSKKKGYFATVFQQNNIRLNGKKLAENDVAEGALTVNLYGIRKPITVSDNFKMKWNYKKPTLKTVNSTTYVLPEMGNVENSFQIRDNSGAIVHFSWYDPMTIDWDKKESAEFYWDGDYEAGYTYSGNSNKENFTLTLQSDYWRETLTAKHTIKKAALKAYLTNTQLTYNLAHKSEAYTNIRIKNIGSIESLCDVVIEGSNAPSQRLVDDDIFEIVSEEGDTGYLQVKLNKAALMEQSPAKGTYAFKLTPYYTAQDGTKEKMNTLNLKLKVVNEEPTVTIKASGKLDLARGTTRGAKNGKSYWTNSIYLKPTFKNLGSRYSVEDAELLGGYSDYFDLEPERYAYFWDYGDGDELEYGDITDGSCYLKVSNGASGKLKAGQTYTLNVKYTIKTDSGDRFTVTAAKQFTVKPVQTAPKVTVTNNNQTFYAATATRSEDGEGGSYNMYRYYDFNVSSEYRITYVSGGLDCNKDGSSDIGVYYYNTSGSSSPSVSVWIADVDAVTASVKGKTYSIPVTVRLYGRDGAAKDAATTIKVTVKR